MERLGQHIESMTFVEGFFDEVAGGALAGEEHHLARRAELAQANRKFHARHAGHDHIRKEKIGSERLGSFQSIKGVIEGSGVEALGLDNRREGRGDNWFVVNYVDQLPVCTFAHGLLTTFRERIRLRAGRGAI